MFTKNVKNIWRKIAMLYIFQFTANELVDISIIFSLDIPDALFEFGHSNHYVPSEVLKTSPIYE